MTVAGHGSGNVNVPTGGCLEVVLFGGSVAAVTVVETVPSGFTPSYIQTTNIGGRASHLSAQSAPTLLLAMSVVPAAPTVPRPVNSSSSQTRR